MSLLAYKTFKVIIECHRKLPCTYEALEIQASLDLQQYQTPIVVKESVLWLGFKRPSTYWGWKRDAQCSASI